MDEKVAMFGDLLYDVHLERCIQCIKIFRHDIVRNYPLKDVEAFEWEQGRRLERDGYLVIRTPVENATRNSQETLGLHGTSWTPRSIYERCATYERKRLRGIKSHDWITEYPVVFLERFLEKGSELDFFALMGIISGRLADHQGEGHSKDYRTYSRLPGFEALRRYLSEVDHQGLFSVNETSTISNRKP
jgi:hypothetical protein